MATMLGSRRVDASDPFDGSEDLERGAWLAKSLVAVAKPFMVRFGPTATKAHRPRARSAPSHSTPSWDAASYDLPTDPRLGPSQ